MPKYCFDYCQHFHCVVKILNTFLALRRLLFPIETTLTETNTGNHTKNMVNIHKMKIHNCRNRFESREDRTMIASPGLWSVVKSPSLTAQASIDRNKKSHPCNLRTLRQGYRTRNVLCCVLNTTNTYNPIFHRNRIVDFEKTD